MTETPAVGFPTRGLYVLTPPAIPELEQLETMVAAALSGGAVAVQFRDKQHDRLERLERATALRVLCREYGVPLIVNDDVDVTGEVQADGVHLGKNDASLASARRILGPRFIIGVSCYDSLARAISAIGEGADYVAFGSFFPSRTKPGAVACSIEVLVEAASNITRPIIAIGGITPENAAGLISSGADLLAVQSSVFSAPDPRASARNFSELF